MKYIYLSIICLCSAALLFGEIIDTKQDLTRQELALLRKQAKERGWRLEITEDLRRAVWCASAARAPQTSGGKDDPLDSEPVWLSDEEYAVGGLRWLDVDNDGDLDLVSCHYEGGYPVRPEQTRIWYNQGAMLEPSAGWISTDEIWSTDLAIGDLDQNGYYDIAVMNGGGYGAPNKIHFNSASGPEATPSWTSTESLFSLNGSIGNVTGSGYLSFAAVNQGTYQDPDKPNHLYGNSTGIPPNTHTWISGDEAQNMSCGFGDYDRDGVIQQTYVFSGNGTRTLFTLPEVPIQRVIAVTVGYEWVTDYTLHLRDGWLAFMRPPYNGQDNIHVTVERSTDLDLAVAVDHGNAKVYHDTGAALESFPSFTVSGSGDRREKGIYWVDIDGDADLDLFVGGRNLPMHIYENTGSLSDTPCWSSADPEPDLGDVDFIDMDNDGDLDMATVNTTETPIIRVYENVAGTLTEDPVWGIGWSAISSMALAVAWGDMDGDGYADLAVGFSGSHIRVYRNVSGTRTNHLAYVEDTSAYRANLGMIQVGGGACSCQVAFRQSDGSLDASKPFTLTPYAYLPVANIIQYLRNDSQPSGLAGSLEIATSKHNRVFAIGGIVNNTSNDPYIQGTGGTVETGTHLLAPLVLRAVPWTTRVSVQNTYSAQTGVDFIFYSATGSQAASFHQDIAANTIFYTDDVIGSAGIPFDGVFSMEVAADHPVRLAVIQESANGTGGIYPCFPFTDNRSAAAKGKDCTLFLPYVEDTVTFRSNLGMITAEDSPVDVTVTFLSADGATTYAKVFTLQPKAYLAVSNIIRNLANSAAPTGLQGSLQISSAAGTFCAIGGIVNNATNDPYVQGAGGQVETGSHLLVPLVLKADVWATKLTVKNTASFSQEATFTFYNPSGGQAAQFSESIAPGACYTSMDIVASAGLADGAYSLFIASAGDLSCTVIQENANHTGGIYPVFAY